MATNEKYGVTIEKGKLKNRQNIHIDRNLPKTERIQSYLRQIGNPYCYLDGDTIVSVRFADTEETLDDRLKACIRNM